MFSVINLLIAHIMAMKVSHSSLYMLQIITIIRIHSPDIIDGSFCALLDLFDCAEAGIASSQNHRLRPSPRFGGSCELLFLFLRSRLNTLNVSFVYQNKALGLKKNIKLGSFLQ